MARPKKDRPRAFLDYQYDANDRHFSRIPILKISLGGYPALVLHANLSIKHNWVSHLVTTDCPEPLDSVLAASKMLSKIEYFKGPIPEDASAILIHYANELSKLGFDCRKDNIVSVTGPIQDAMNNARKARLREIIAENND